MNRRDFLHRTVTAAGLGTAAIASHALGLDGNDPESTQTLDYIAPKETDRSAERLHRDWRADYNPV